MFFIARYKQNITCPHRMPLTLPINFTLAGMDEHFMFPIMRMPGRMSAGRNFKDSHAKIIGTVILAYHHTRRDALYFSIFKMSRRDVSILDNFHSFPFDEWINLCIILILLFHLTDVDWQNIG
jgi:hypothetical protein